MSDFKYVIDSSVIIRRSQYQRYERDSFPHHWQNFDDRIEEGLFVSTPLVKTEINAKNKELLNWVGENDKMFDTVIDQNVADELTLLSKKFSLWYKTNQEKTKVWADPEIIAFAKAHDITVVTQEKWNPDAEEQNYRIPTICSKIGGYCQIRDKCSTEIDIDVPFQCIDFLELIKREKLYQI